MQSLISVFEHEIVDLDWSSRDAADADQLCRDLGCQVLSTVYSNGRLKLKAAQYVGVYHLRERIIQVLPKFYRDGTSTQERVFEATRNLLHLLCSAYSLPLELRAPLPLASQPTAWFEVLSYIFGSRLLREWRRSASHDYQSFDLEAPVLAGSWRVSEQLRHPERKTSFAIRRDSYTVDNALNRVFRYVVERLFAVTQDAENRRLFGSLRGWMDEVTLPPRLSSADCPPSLINRLNATYEPLLNLARLFLESGSLQLAHGRRQVHGFILDMNRLFESFVYSFINRHRASILPECWRRARILPQTSGACRHLASTNGYQVFLLKPDISVVLDNSHLLVLDSKYKVLNRDEQKLGVSESDLYQMLAYIQRYRCPRIVLVYPQTAGMAEPICQTFTIHGSPAVVDVATVDLTTDLGVPANIHGLVAQFRSIIREREPCHTLIPRNTSKVSTAL